MTPRTQSAIPNPKSAMVTCIACGTQTPSAWLSRRNTTGICIPCGAALADLHLRHAANIDGPYLRTLTNHYLADVAQARLRHLINQSAIRNPQSAMDQTLSGAQPAPTAQKAS